MRLGMLVGALLLTPAFSLAGKDDGAKEQAFEGKRGDVVRQGFPAQNADDDDVTKSETGWEIDWDLAPVLGKKVKLFRIVQAKFFWKDADKRTRSLVVARNIQLAEAFAQYDDKDTCFLDIAADPATKNLKAKEEFLGPSCVKAGKILRSHNPVFDNMVHKEVHYDGLRWMSVYVGRRAHKGEKLILWSAIQSGNYIFLIEYNFTDDGRIVCRFGFTAHNYFDRAEIPGKKSRDVMKIPEGDVHLHIGCWRLEFDLSDPLKGKGGPRDNQLMLVRRVFEEGRFKAKQAAFPWDAKPENKGKLAREGKAKWVAADFTSLRAESTVVKNSRGAPTSYELVPTRFGSAEGLLQIGDAEDVKADMDFINYDFWVTRTPKKYGHYHEVPKLAEGELPLKGQATTIWYSAPALHMPRDEDFGPGGVDAAKGLALTNWIEFTLRPRNLFDATPFY